MRGAWIETPAKCKERQRRSGRAPCGARGLKREPRDAVGGEHGSRPVRGAWIETYRACPYRPYPSGRAPCGARGLKLFEGGTTPVITEVAPRAGRVD